MTRRRLPSYAALRVFDTVARTLHFTRAADELGLTQAAVSRQVSALERELGVRLINRQPGGNTLTGAGAKLSVGLREGLDRIADSVREASARQQQTLTISVAPFFSAAWLTPRLAGFAAMHPGIDIRLHHAYRPPDYTRDDIDMGINWGNGNWPGVIAERVLDGSLTPVCFRQLADSLPSVLSAEQVLELPLYCEFAAAHWTDWLSAAGIASHMPATDVHVIDDTHAMLTATRENSGFALMFASLLADSPYAGQFVQPFPESLDTGEHYFLTRPARQPLSAPGRKFRTWLLSELPPQ